MTNIKYRFDNGVLHIAIAVDGTILAGAPPSASGKSRLVASSHGNAKLRLPTGEEVSLGLNVYTPR